MRNLTVSLLWLALALALAGCARGTACPQAAAPIAAAPLPPTAPPEEGSLWSPRQPHGLVADHRAANVGDLVTISITESAKGSGIATTQTSKTSGVKVSIGSLFGLSFPMKSFTDQEAQTETALETAVGNTSKGEGKTERQSTFTTYLSARVIQVLPNQHLVVQGRRHLRINNETEVVTLTGIVRPQDIDRNNVVPSTKLAEAKLDYSGVGVVSDKQRQGWAVRLFDHLWPF
ncbi:MAG: flagellar basal body L-ring protein FlgH [Deltaproteobacteria bacterium]|nr:flagellar basal body L-ring protein FlgH [Deltaproteobacteria bacterium]